jgi:HEAT repeat protein
MKATMKLCLAALVCLLAGLSTLGQTQEDALRYAKQLKDKDTDLRRQAAKAIGEMGPAAKAAVPALAEALKDKDRFVRRIAAQSLGKIGPEAGSPAATALGKALKDEETEVVEAAADALSKMGSAGIEPLIAGLKDKDPFTKRVAARALGQMGSAAKPAVPALLALFKEPQPKMSAKSKVKEIDVRKVVAESLGKIGPDAREAVPALKEALEGKTIRDRELREMINEALKRIGRKG